MDINPVRMGYFEINGELHLDNTRDITIIA